MIQILGRVTTVSANNTNATFTLTDGSTHQYNFNNGKIYYIVTNSGEQEKYIELCSDVKLCSFIYDSESRVLTTQINIGDITYNNKFNI